jgi:hypothetical protein
MNNPVNKCASKLNRQFSTKVQLANKYMKKCLIFLAIVEIHIKTILRFHFTPFRMAIIRKTNNSKCWWGGREKHFYTFGNVNCYTHYEN